MRPPARPPVSRLRRALSALTATALVLAAGVTASIVVASPAQAAGNAIAAESAAVAETATTEQAATSAAPASVSFTAGHIIDDETFYDSTTMTAAQIQSFLNGKVSQCRSGYTCLKDFKQTTVNRPADSYCSAYRGAANESAAQIIAKVSVACGMNPRVLLVMLQKEQGLVTHVWPSDFRYDAALGQSCPDTPAGCDPAFKGFFLQMYGGARQMKVYKNSGYFSWYPVGKTSNVLYQDARVASNCGSGPVFIQNIATASLYYYTPYQPNKASLAAGYGKGDRCSAYGNRNFYNYFTDWFGSTYAANDQLVKVGADIWLVSGTKRYHITAEAWPQYRTTFPSPKVITNTALQRYTNGGDATFYIRNATTGEIAYLADGKRHWFSSCDLVAAWGGTCAGAIDLQPREFTAWTSGEAMTSWARKTATGVPMRLVGNELQPMYDLATAASYNGGRAPYAPVMRASVLSKKTTSSVTRFIPGTFVRVDGTSEVWLVDAEKKTKHHLLHWAYATEAGLTASARVINKTGLNGYATGADMSLFITCASTTYLVASKKLYAADTSATGFASVPLGADNCAKLSIDAAPATRNAVILRSVQASPVYHLVDGKLRHIQNAAQRRAVNGGAAPGTEAKLSAAAFARLAVGDAYPTPGTLVRGKNTAEVYYIDDLTLLHLPRWNTATEYGLRVGGETLVAPSALKNMGDGGTMNAFVACGGTTYAVAGGRLTAVPAASVDGNAVTAISNTFCSARAKTSPVSGRVFLTDGTKTKVAVASGFLSLPTAASERAAADGKPVTKLRVSADYLAALAPAKVPGDGALVKAANDPVVALITGGSRLRLPNWGVGTDLGLGASKMVTTSATALATAPLQSAPELSIFISCADTTYVATQGVLRRVPASALGGFVPTKLSAKACGVLNRSGAATSGKLVFTDGKKKWIARSGVLVPASASETGTVIRLDARTIAGMD